MCRALGRIPTMGTFRQFYVNSISNEWLSFSKRGGADDPCCYSKKFDSLKNWKNRFFWIDASVCPLSTSWFSGTSVVKDPLPVDEAVDLPCVELLNENHTLIRKYPETFLCLVGLSRSFIDTDVRPTLLHDNDEEEEEGGFFSGSPLVKKAQTEGKVIFYSRPSTAEDVTSSSVTPTPEHVLEDALHENVRTRPPSSRFVVLSSGSANTDIPATFQVVSLVSSSQASISVPVTEFAGDSHPLSAPEHETETLSTTPSQGSSADDFYESQTVDSATAMNVYVPNWNVTNNARVDNPVICRSLLDLVTPPGYWAALRNQGDVGFLDAFNINSPQYICMADAKVVELKVKLKKSESKAAEVEELRKRVFDLEAMVAVKVGEAASLTTQNAGLLEKDAAERRFTESVVELDARIADVRRDMDNDLYPHMLTAIAGRRWVVGHGIQQGLEAGVVHGKAGRSLTQIEAYDPKVEGKYVVAVFEFEGVSFPLLDDLESLKDSPFALIMSALILKDGQGDTDATPEFAWFQPSLDEVAVLIYSESGSVDREMLLSDAIPAIRQSVERRGLCPPSSSALGGTFGSAPSHDSSLGVMDYQVSTLVLSGDGGPTNLPPVAQPHDDLFDTSVLDKSGDV
ncbi:hypothetical protein Tco_1082863 [Tanacetum coccineum]|uniref:Transposase (Putative), gypsy type n=1 Tax=Tanacetum coccineum TaxID=301880 RepID=A0ABQ5I1U1_9ASTR